MKAKLMSIALAGAFAAWAQNGEAREAVALPGVVGPVGEVSGVDTTGPGTLTVGAQNINTSNDPGGGVTTNAANTANIDFTSSSTVTGFTGTIGSQFLNINAGANGTIVNFNGAVFATTVIVTGTGTVNFNGNVSAAPAYAGDGFINLAAGSTLSGAVTTAAAGTGTLTLNGGSAVLGAVGGGNGLRLINVAGGNASITGAVQTLGFGLNANLLTITGALTTNAGGTISTTLASNTVFGRVLVTGASNINAGGITVIPTVTGVLSGGTNFRIVSAPAGTAGASVFVINNNPRYTFAGVTTTTGDVNILLTHVAPLVTLVNAPGATAVAGLLDVTAAPGSDLLTVQDAIAVLPSAAALNNALAQLGPSSANLAAPWVATQSTGLFEDMWATRMEEVQSLCCDVCEPNSRPTPAAARKCGPSQQRGNWWVKAVDSLGRQGDQDGVNGYRAKTLGMMLAYDAPLGSQARAGIGLGVANTNIDANNSSARTKVESYRATAYLSYAPGPFFVQGALAAGTDGYKGTRPISFPGINREADADYRGRQYTAMLSAGKHFYPGQNIVTPLASLQASRVHVDGYTESGAGDIDLRVQKQDYNFLQSGLGVKAERIISAGSVTFSPEAHLKWLHDFSSTTMQQTAVFTGAPGSFTAAGVRQDRNLYNAGAGISLFTCDCSGHSWTIKAVYDYRWNRSDYAAHQLALIASIKL